MRNKLIVTTGAAALVAAGLMLAGCGGTTATSNLISSNVATTPTQTIITDAPADQVLALALKVDNIVLTDTSGASTGNLLKAPVPIEVGHLDAVQEPFLPPLNIPQDTYASATITVEAPIVAYVDSTSAKPVIATTSSTPAATLTGTTDTITLSTPITVTATSAPIVFDLEIAQSVSITGTGTSAVIDVTPTFNVTQLTLPTGTTPPSNQNQGKVSNVVGAVASTTTSSLTITDPKGQSLTITTNSNTQLYGATSLSALTAGELVSVDIAQQTNGSNLALRITVLPNIADLLIGPVTATTGTPVTSFTQLVRQPVGPGTTPASTLATSYTITVNSSTTFSTGPQGTAGAVLPTLPFTPTFSAATLFAGQNVAVGSTSINTTADTATAVNVTLVPQTIDGTVAAVGTSGGLPTVTVTLPAQSALATLTGKTSVVVYVVSATQLMNSTTAIPTAGAQIRFNGLLFNNAGTLSLVALGCNDAPPTPPRQTIH
jgi:hypothetical protein